MSNSRVPNIALAAPIASGVPREIAWQQGAALTQAPPVETLEQALRRAARHKTRALHAVLVLPGLGRFDIAVRDESSAIELHLRCHAVAGHTWLCARRAWLERRLVHCLGRRVRLCPVLVATRTAP